jgi:hypothetical protein
VTAIALSLLVALSACARTPAPVRQVQDPRVAAIDSVQNYLAGEHAAIWAYGRAAALLPKNELAGAIRIMKVHERERDQISSTLRSDGVKPRGALVAYDEGQSLTTANQAREFLVGVEGRLAALALAVKSVPSKP